MVFAWRVSTFTLIGSQYGIKILICTHIAYNVLTGLHQFCCSPVSSASTDKTFVFSGLVVLLLKIINNAFESAGKTFSSEYKTAISNINVSIKSLLSSYGQHNLILNVFFPRGSSLIK